MQKEEIKKNDLKKISEHIGHIIGVVWIIIIALGLLGFLLQITGVWNFKSKKECTIIHKYPEDEYVNCD